MDARQARRVRTDVTTHKTRIPVRAGFKPAQSMNRLQTSVERRSPRCWSIATVSPRTRTCPSVLAFVTTVHYVRSICIRACYSLFGGLVYLRLSGRCPA
jgi:hypothetical protein